MSERGAKLLSSKSARALAIERVRGRLLHRSSPRLHMFVLVAATAACGFVASYALLKVGVTTMAIRYPLAVGLAYLAFLGLVSVWLRRFRIHARAAKSRNDFDIDLDVLEIPFDAMWSAAPPADAPAPFGGGGGFRGGGGGTSWGEGAVSPRAISSVKPGGGGGWDLDLDDGALWLVPVAIIVAIAFGILLYIVYLAPVLFAELLLDAGLAAGLYRRLARVERRTWLATAVRSTIIPAGFVAVMLGLAGLIMQRVYPDAGSIGGVVRHVQRDRESNSESR